MLQILRDNEHMFKPSPRRQVIGESLFAGVLRGQVKCAAAKVGLVKTLNDVVRSMVPNHHFTTIVINRNTQSRPHVDAYNTGPSIITSVGMHTGGELVVGGIPIDIHNRIVQFSGKVEHYNEMYDGERYSIIWFVHSSFRSVDVSKLIALGFNPPLTDPPKPKLQ